MQDAIAIAKEVRQKCDKIRRNLGFPEDLCGMCAIASVTLKTALLKSKIQSSVIVGHFDWDGIHINFDNHCWLECNDNIIDITATQFEFESEVFVTNKSDKRYNKRYVLPNKITNSLDFFREHDWSEDQIPKIFLVHKILKVT